MSCSDDGPPPYEPECGPTRYDIPAPKLTWQQPPQNWQQQPHIQQQNWQQQPLNVPQTSWFDFIFAHYLSQSHWLNCTSFRQRTAMSSTNQRKMYAVVIIVNLSLRRYIFVFSSDVAKALKCSGWSALTIGQQQNKGHIIGCNYYSKQLTWRPPLQLLCNIIIKLLLLLLLHD